MLFEESILQLLTRGSIFEFPLSGLSGKVVDMADAMDLSMYTPEMLAQIPAGIAPGGVTSNLINPPTAGYYVLVANSILMFGMYIFTGLRLYVAMKVRGKFAVDDWVTVAAIVGSCYYYITVCLAIVVDKFGTHLWDLSVAHMRTRNMAIIGFMSNGPTHLIWPTIKTIFFIMYLNLFRPLTWMRRCVYAGLAVVWLWYVAISVTQMVITAPPPGKGWVESFATPRYLQTFKLTVPVSSFSVASDLYVLLLPLIAISHLKLSASKRLCVAAMFSTGLVCCCASSVTLYFQYRIYLNQSDYTYYVVFVYLGYTIEMCVGISTACMPSLARLHKDRISQSRSSAYGSSRKNTNNSNNSRLSIMDGYSKRSPYLPMEENSERGSHSHELGRLPSNPDSTIGIATTHPQDSYDPRAPHWGASRD